MVERKGIDIVTKLPVSRTSRLAAAVLAASLATPVLAAKFDLGPFEANFTSNFSIGASWRTEDASNRVITPGNTDGKGRAASSTADDGNLNYDQGICTPFC